MYEVLVAWGTMPTGPDQPAVIGDFAEVWRAADEVVYSPEAVRRLEEEADAELSVSGPSLAASERRAGLVDELHLFVNPVVVRGGRPRTWIRGALTQRRSPES